MPADDLESLRRHLEACWGLVVPTLGPGDTVLPATAGNAPWALYAAVVGDVRIRVWPSAPGPDRSRLLRRAARALAGAGGSSRVRREVVLVWAGPGTGASSVASPLTDADSAAIEAFEAGSAPYFLAPERRPVLGVFGEGRLLSIAHSSRRTALALELGINTRPDARRRGLATAAVGAWTRAVQTQEGLQPLYSAAWDNTASLALARACGYRPIARAAMVPPAP